MRLEAIRCPLTPPTHPPGSPVVLAVKQRLEGIRKEYADLDTVWFMAGSLFNKYPSPPTETFSFDVFKCVWGYRAGIGVWKYVCGGDDQGFHQCVCVCGRMIRASPPLWPCGPPFSSPSLSPFAC